MIIEEHKYNDTLLKLLMGIFHQPLHLAVSTMLV